MGYHLSRLDEPVFVAVSKPLLTEFGFHLRLESFGWLYLQENLKGLWWFFTNFTPIKDNL